MFIGLLNIKNDEDNKLLFKVYIIALFYPGIQHGQGRNKMTKVQVLAGKKSIGGNFRVTDRDRVLIFDQGMRFDIW